MSGKMKYSWSYCEEYSSSRGYELLGQTIKKERKCFIFKHTSCGNVFNMTWGNFYNKEQDCPECSKKQRRIPLDLCKDEARKRGYVLLSEEYFGNKVLMKFLHLDCEKEINITWDNFSGGHGCKYCFGSISPTIGFCKKESENRGYKLLSKKYIKNSLKLKFRHVFCGFDFYMSWNSFYNAGSGCPKCKKSKGVLKIIKILESFGMKENIDYSLEYRFDDCFEKGKLPFDLYLYKYNLCIEYHGIQHYEPVKFFGGNKKFKERRNRDSIKERYCSEKGIGLLVIPYTEDKNIKEILRKELNI